MNKGKTSRFNTVWLGREEYKDWLLPEESANTKDVQKTFSLSNMGETGVKSHAEGKKHASSVKVSQRTESVSDFFKRREISTEKCSSEKSVETSSGLAFSRKIEQESSQLTKLALRKEQHKAEILWALNSLMSHFS